MTIGKRFIFALYFLVIGACLGFAGSDIYHAKVLDGRIVEAVHVIDYKKILSTLRRAKDRCVGLVDVCSDSECDTFHVQCKEQYEP